MVLLWGLCCAASFYQFLALIACIRQLRKREPAGAVTPPISILKPVRGADSAFYEALRSHAEQDYPEFEILCGISQDADPAIGVIERVAREYPHVPIQIVHCRPDTPNRKAGVLIELNRQARYPLRVVNDGDIAVPHGYLRQVTAPLTAGHAGLVTCLYRARADSFPARFEALGIATDFAPSALVAPLTGVNEFGMGSTLAFAADTLEAVGGFEAVAPYIADDYQVGKRISQTGKPVWLSSVVVETHLHGGTWRDVWQHQVRWARTIRISRPGGYAGIPITNAVLWALVAAAAGQWIWTAALLVLRMLVAWICASRVLQATEAVRLLWLVPARDLWGFAIWIAGLAGRTVVWGGEILRLDGEGRIVR